MWQVFWYTGDIQPTTLKEYSEEIQTLNQTEEKLDFQWETFRIGAETLESMMRHDLSLQEKEHLELLVYSYTQARANSSWESLPEVKKEFYTQLLVYITPDKQAAFQKHIDTEYNIDIEKLEVAEKKEQTQEAYEEYKDELREKAEENAEILEQQITLVLQQKIYSRLTNFTQTEKFSQLPKEAKIEVFQKFSTKLELERKKLEANKNRTTFKKIFAYKVVQEILQEYIDGWK